jgi:hypothetical protein
LITYNQLANITNHIQKKIKNEKNLNVIITINIYE